MSVARPGRGMDKAQPGDSPSEVGEVVINLGAGESGSELYTEGLEGDLPESIHINPREIKNLKQKVREVPVPRGNVLSVEAGTKARDVNPGAEASLKGRIADRALLPPCQPVAGLGQAGFKHGREAG